MITMSAWLFLAGCSTWSADSVDIDGDAAGLVRDMLRPWEGATQRAPRVRNVNVTGANPPGCYESCFDADSETIWLDADLPPARMNRALSVALGRSLDDDGHGAARSESGAWAYFGGLSQTYTADRFANAVGLGPLGVQIFPGANWHCDNTDSLEDVLLARRSVFSDQTQTLSPAAEVVRYIAIEGPFYHLAPQRLEGGGIALIGKTTPHETDEVARIDIPDLDGDNVRVTYPDPGYSWYPPQGQVLIDPPGETAWAPGLGAELVGNFPIGDTEIAGAWLESTDPQKAEEAPFVVLERERDGGEVVAVHNILCPPREADFSSRHSYHSDRPFFVPTKEGVWVISYSGTWIYLQRFGYGGKPLASRWVSIDIESTYGGEPADFWW